MSSYTLSGEVDADNVSIVRTSVRLWELARAERYILDLHATFERLAGDGHRRS